MYCATRWTLLVSGSSLLRLFSKGFKTEHNFKNQTTNIPSSIVECVRHSSPLINLGTVSRTYELENRKELDVPLRFTPLKLICAQLVEFIQKIE